jgi:nitrous oxidase accessory protein NosD
MRVQFVQSKIHNVPYENPQVDCKVKTMTFFQIPVTKSIFNCSVLGILFLIVTPVSTSVAQTLLDVNFDDVGFGSQLSTYSEIDIERDFGELRFTNGVDEGRVKLVTGDQAFGGTGASLRVEYPANGTGPREGGAQWLVEFDTDVEEAFLTYRVKFGAGFDFVRGGKLPGLAGGSAPSGSAPADGVRGWSGRMMWRTNFTGVSGEPEQSTTQAISYAKHVNSGFDRDGRQEDTEFWFNRDGSDTTLQADVWYTIQQRIKLNTPGVRDGILQIWLDGRLVLAQNDIQFRNIPDLKVDRFFFSTFFGGGDEWRSSKDEVVFFDDFKITVPQERLVPEQYPNAGAAFAACNPGDTILLGSADWFANLYLNKPLVTLRGRGNARLMGARGDQPVIQADADSIRISDLAISRGAAGVEAFPQAGGLEIQNCDFVGNFGDAIRMIGCRDVVIQNTNMISNEGRGIFLNQVEGFYVDNCDATDSGGAGFELFSNGGFVSNCNATGNKAGAGFFYIGDRSGFQNNSSFENQGMGFLLVNSQFNSVVNCTAEGNTTFGILAFGVEDSFFSQNFVSRSGDVGVLFDNSQRNAIQDSESSFNNGIGAYFSPSTAGNYLTRNQYFGNAFSLGLIDQGSNTVDE